MDFKNTTDRGLAENFVPHSGLFNAMNFGSKILKRSSDHLSQP